MNVQEITSIAQKIRKEFEEGTVPLPLIEERYQKYNPVESEEFFTKAQELFPSLNCGIASVYLQVHLPGSQIVKGKYKENNHTFLRVNEMIIDITADQYGGPEVYVGPLVSPWSSV